MSDLAAQLLERRGQILSNTNAVIATLEDHGARQIPITPELAAAVPVLCAQLARDPSARVKAKAAQLILAASKYNLERLVHADKAGRLDSGEATENIATSNTHRIMAGDKEAEDAIAVLAERLYPSASVPIQPAPHANGRLNGSLNGNGTHH